MLKAVEGVFKKGKIELKEPIQIEEGTPVIVIFTYDSQSIDLADRRISQEQAADLRWRLSSFADDWDRPEMDSYDAL